MIRIKDLVKDYTMGHQTFRALHGINFHIPPGSLVAIVGQSGSGKTTLMNLLGGLDSPTSGEYWLNGRNVSQFDAVEWSHERNRTIGFVFQNFNLMSTMTALANVELPLIYRRVPRRVRHEQAAAALYQVGLGDRLHHLPTQLSGGQQQRVAIARALVGDPPLILADEPTGNLDAATGEEILAVLKALNRQGRTVVMVTHSPDVARQCRRILNMKDGYLTSSETEDGVTVDDLA